MCNDGEKIYSLVQKLFPICRSITGEGVRETIKILQELCPELEMKAVASGTKVFDWKIPQEWNISEGYIENEKGQRILDFSENNLHVLGYSDSIDKILSLEELKKHLYTQPEQKNVIPYVTSYYKNQWGFCMTQQQFDALMPGNYHAVIKSSKTDGVLNYCELMLPGISKKEVLISTYLCHPSMANDNLSSVCVTIYLVKWLQTIKKHKYTYRVVFVPDTIGSIAYINLHLETLKKNVEAALCLSCMGDDAIFSYVATKYNDTLIDKLVVNNLKYSGRNYKLYSFLERGSDERQYGFPGIDLPAGGVCRSKYHTFPEYHTSADNLSHISKQGLQNSLDWLKELICTLEVNAHYQVTCMGEPQLGRRNLYPTTSQKNCYGDSRVIQNFLAYADGKNDLIDIANYIHCSAYTLKDVVAVLLQENLIIENSVKQITKNHLTPPRLSSSRKALIA